jgi:paraquat-inducible protein B
MRQRDTVVETYLMKFTQSVRGLAVGSPVDFRGITVGEVKRIDLDFDPQTVKFRAVVEVALYPERLRSRFRNGTRPFTNLTPQQRMQRFVEHGFRGQLRSGNLLTGQLYVALDFFDNEPKAQLDLSQALPEIPTVKQGGLGELQESLARIIAKLEKVPFDSIAQDLRRALQDLDTTLKKTDAVVGKLNDEVAPQLAATLEQARKSLAAAETVLGTESPLQGDLRDTLSDVSRTAQSLRELVDYLERHPESLIRGKRPTGDAK